MNPPTPQDDRLVITPALAQRLVAQQFPQWAHLAVRPVPIDGWDNHTFRLGDALSVRLPSHLRYAAQVDKEHRWLPVLAPQLPLPIPTPLAMGKPTQEYPYHWSIYRWVEGEPAALTDIADTGNFAETLADFLTRLYTVDAADGPAAGEHNFYRGGSLRVYHDETLRTIAALDDAIDGKLAHEIWQASLCSVWQPKPVWVHGDVAPNNLLVQEGRLHAVIDFGTSGVGDPACDLTIAWTLLDEAGREAFRRKIALDDDTWARARGWALWKAMLVLHGSRSNSPDVADQAMRVISAVMDDHQQSH